MFVPSSLSIQRLNMCTKQGTGFCSVRGQSIFAIPCFLASILYTVITRGHKGRAGAGRGTEHLRALKVVRGERKRKRWEVSKIW
jgi:hypothetical protein